MSDLKVPVSCEQFEAHVSAYIDGALSASDRAAMDAHLTQCASCLALLADVRAIVGSAATLAPLSPSRDLWSGIAERLDTPVVSIGTANPIAVKRARTVSFRVFAAAAALLVSVSSGITYLVTRGNSAANVSAPTEASVPVPANTTSGSEVSTANVKPDPIPAIAALSTDTAVGSESGRRSNARYTSRVENSAEIAYEREITAMRRIVDERLGDLDSVTVVEIERNLRIIDKAINDSRRALQNDPRSGFLSKQLDRALENKLDIMRRIALL